MRYKISYIIGLCILFFLNSCSTSKFVEPLKARENAVAVDLGGPLINVPGLSTLPIPFTSITYGRGISNRLTLQGSWYSTAAIFGVGQISLGATYGLWKSYNLKHGISGMLGFNTAMDFFENNFKFWPRLDVHYYWKYNLKALKQSDLMTGGPSPANLLYAGFESWWELNPVKTNGKRTGPFVIPSLVIGHDLNWKKWTFKAELKFIAPYLSNQDIVVDYVSFTGKWGATGIYIGFSRKF